MLQLEQLNTWIGQGTTNWSSSRHARYQGTQHGHNFLITQWASNQPMK